MTAVEKNKATIENQEKMVILKTITAKPALKESSTKELNPIVKKLIQNIIAFGLVRHINIPSLMESFHEEDNLELEEGSSGLVGFAFHDITPKYNKYKEAITFMVIKIKGKLLNIIPTPKEI